MHDVKTVSQKAQAAKKIMKVGMEPENMCGAKSDFSLPWKPHNCLALLQVEIDSLVTALNEPAIGLPTDNAFKIPRTCVKTDAKLAFWS